ncbi:FAD-dependent thymidylate synthase [Dethiosulfovibrio sp. F2B]|uniref:FAD-dependent thymidylate synthase n=1 Tax=Dethiosulfovibrio faecalis TaxID=2720018 RepID=UPI001F2B28DB|nr:FAD-dependent thymidylate synthase [Dethiosulfovibrio faecalis]MCF4152110.1 FAD-dependent thymidylate synthase [Dethiosulfovibrio faecalis]
MRVDLIYTTPDYLMAVWLAGHTCHSPKAPQELYAEPASREKMLKLADFLIEAKHLSVMEHCSMTFAVSGVSRTLLAQYSRHRIGVSLSVQSQRYVSERSDFGAIFDHVTPPTVSASPEAMEIFSKAMESCQDCYDRLLDVGIPREDARFVLPGAITTNFVTTLNLRSFLDVYSKRVSVKGAQWEIRELLVEMGRLLLEKESWLETYLGSNLEEKR